MNKYQLAESDEALARAPYKVLADWHEEHDGNLRIILPDTYGTKGFLENAPDWLAGWTGIRVDSGAPEAGAETAIRWWQERGEDPREKMVIFSDGLDVDDADGLVTLSAAARSFCRASASSARRTSLRDMRFAATRSDPSGFFLGEKNGMPSLRLGSAGGDRARLSSSAQSDLVGRRAVSCSRARTMVCAGDGEKVSPVGRVNCSEYGICRPFIQF